MVGTKKTSYFHTKGHMKKLARLVGRGNETSIARFILSHPGLRRRVVQCIIKLLRCELSTLSSDKLGSIMREKSQTAMEYFTWESLWQELSSHAPTFFSILQGLSLKPSSTSAQVKPVACICAAILLKLRNPKMCQVQAMISLLLHIGHSSKQV